MRIRITVDVDVANNALLALSTYAANVARIAKHEPNPNAFNWAAHLQQANDNAEEFRKAVGNAELVAFD